MAISVIARQILSFYLSRLPSMALPIILAMLGNCHVNAVFNETLALQFAHLASVAGCPNDSLEDWSCAKCTVPVTSVKVCLGSTTKAYVGIWDDTCIIGFEGTHDVFSVITDLRFSHAATPWDTCHDCRVHSGFLAAYQSLRPCLLSTLESRGCKKGSKIRVTGWSLGAAQGTLAMVDLSLAGWTVDASYDFGKPRVGDENFTAMFDTMFKDHGGVWRVTHAMDPVPHLPPAELITNWHFAHVEPEAFYSGVVRDGHKECYREEDPKCSAQFPSLAFDALHAFDHFTYMDVRMGKAGCTNSLTAIHV
eukprot:TRINITY_DN10605_c0_g11_i1.p1 TRINITY_DN10605_c0_g11~~TRINITY_DN10605_c0_g11_i1.p1  ORF type:complete len:307 (+),score=24.51 TRINITY_DN10605_c0_g11_i1:47-967(+)